MRFSRDITRNWATRLWSRLTLNAQLILLYSSLMVASVVLLSLFTFSSVGRIVRELKLQNTREVVEQIRNNSDTNLTQIDKLSYVVFANAEVLRILRENQRGLESVSSRERLLIEGLLIDAMFARDDISGLVLYTNNGRSIQTQAPPTDLTFETIAALADEADGRLTWIPTSAESSTISAVRKIYDPELTPLGYLQLDLWKSHLQQMLSDSLADIGGTIVVRQSGEVILGPSDLVDILPSVDVFPEETGSAAGVEMYESDDRIVVNLRSRVNDWGFSATVPLASIYRDIRYLRTFAILASIVAITVFIVASSFIARGFIRPIHDIAEQMKSASLGDWSPELNDVPNNEIFYLSTEFKSMIARINGLVDRVVESESRTARQQLEVLQAQINPHFLYNALDVINWMARRQGAPQIADIVGALSAIMRYCISPESMTALNQELMHVEQYVLIQQARFRDRFHIDISVPENLRQVELPRLTLQPLVENAILHGFKGVGRPGVLQLSAEVVRGEVEIHVTDNGVGMSPELIHEVLGNDNTRGGIGLANVHRRLQLTFGDHCGLKIHSETGKGSDILFRIPLPEGEAADV